MSAAALLSLLMVGGTPAMAAEPDSTDVKMYFKVNGEFVEASADDFDLDLSEPVAPEPGTISPQLIDFNQWFSCFTLNNQDDVYRTYNYWYNGVNETVRLKCGTENWGYKHIRAGKEANWQARLDQARANGWNSQAQGVESWDDLMAGVTVHAITYAEYGGDYPQYNKRCGTNEVYFMNTSTGEIVYSFWVVASWATDSDRLITSYSPSTPAYTC